METGQIQILNQQQQILNNQRVMRQELAFDTAMIEVLEQIDYFLRKGA